MEVNLVMHNIHPKKMIQGKKNYFIILQKTTFYEIVH